MAIHSLTINRFSALHFQIDGAQRDFSPIGDAA